MYCEFLCSYKTLHLLHLIMTRRSTPCTVTSQFSVMQKNVGTISQGSPNFLTEPPMGQGDRSKCILPKSTLKTMHKCFLDRQHESFYEH